MECLLRRIETALMNGGRRAGAFRKRKRRCEPVMVRSDVVPVTGLEPVRCFQQGILSPWRLPIPPHRQIGLFILSPNLLIVKEKDAGKWKRSAGANNYTDR